MERDEQLKGHKQKQCWSENYKVEDVSSCHGFHWSCDLGEPGGLCFPIWERGKFLGVRGSCSISLIADENGGLLWCPESEHQVKKHTHKNTFDSLSTSCEKKRWNDANQSPSASTSITTSTKREKPSLLMVEFGQLAKSSCRLTVDKQKLLNPVDYVN